MDARLRRQFLFQLKRLHNPKCSLSKPRLIAISDATLFPPPFFPLLPIGSFLILRDYDLEDRETIARQLLTHCRTHKMKLLVGADPLLAQRIGADGVHWPEHIIKEARAWQKKKPHWQMTASAHTRRSLVLCEKLQLMTLYSPVFPTDSHKEANTLGILAFRRAVHRHTMPIYALGGITPATLPRLSASHAAGVAILRAGQCFLG